MTNTELKKERIIEVLFHFRQSIYHFTKSESNHFSLSWEDVYLLQILARHDSLTVTELAEKLKVKNFTASRMISRLAAQNLVQREPSLDDRRVVKVSVTPQGKKKLQAIEDFNYNALVANFNSLKEEDIQTLMDSLKKMDILLG